ncbi:uncharacterized protein LOC141794701 isoform X2 [Halichoeres trimaculatus]|uniref:uncharacterized protein LOC141794701 isoform X2 n=1 Tax=Halichoeres trimaculatus TaxID=147232 RepID=UPI003D9E0886
MRPICKVLHQATSRPDRKAGDGVGDRPRRATLKPVHGPDPDEEAEARRRARMEQRHLEAYWSMHRLRDALCRRYAALLEDKVRAQRSQLQQRQEAGRARSEDQIQQKLKKFVSSKPQHDDSYLKTIPKSCFYLIFDLQRQLAERGHLKTHHDLEDFYRSIEFRRHPSELQKSLEGVRRRMLENRPAAGLMGSEKSLCSAEDEREEDDVSDSRLSKQASAEERPAELIFCGNKEEKDGCEPVFPKMKAPAFATLQPDFMRNFQNKIQDLILPEIPQKSRKAEVYLRRLREMHDRCLSNMSVSQRLLDRETDSLLWQEERGGDPDLVLPGVDSKQRGRSQTNQLLLCSLKQPQSVQRERAASSKQLNQETSHSRHLYTETQRCDSATQRSRKTPDPLSMEDLCLQKHVEVVGGDVKFWRNYTEHRDH